MRMKSAVNFFLEQYKNPNTIATYRRTLEAFTRSVGEDREVGWVTPAEVQRFVNDSIARKLSDYTIYKQHKEIKAFFNFLIRMGFLTSNPAHQVRVRRPEVPVDERDVITSDEMKQVVEYVSLRGNVKVEAICRFIADTGCRRIGVANLMIYDLDLDNNSALVVEKGDKRRSVFYSDTTRIALFNWLMIRPKEAKHQHVFCSDGRNDYKPMEPPSIAQAIRRACVAAGVGSHGPHEWWHRRGYELGKKGVPTSVIAKVLGHSDDGRIAARHYTDYSRATTEETARQTFPDLSTTQPRTQKIVPLRVAKR